MFHENEKIIGIPKDIQHLPVAHVLSLSLEAARAIHTGAVPPTSQCRFSTPTYTVVGILCDLLNDHVASDPWQRH
ncbi:hypothetical protein V5799_015175 [Amblyomma americanum]|uniref:Uncharacterized protein n=1 Tax=Amblyomma americanum TaxID=6943 RepID=A0AAQ4E0W9_AMBAM